MKPAAAFQNDGGVCPSSGAAISAREVDPIRQNPPLRCTLLSPRTATLRRSRSPAFTLIEILLATAIFGMVLMAIYATWTLILRSAKIGQDVAAQAQRERVAMHRIKEALECVMSFQADPHNYSFLADNDSGGSLSFVARLPETFPRSERIAFDGFDVRRVNFSVENDKEMQPQLVLRQTPLLKEFDSDEEGFPYVLAKGVEKMELQFWDQRKSDYIDEWTRTNELPKSIKIKLEFLRRNPNKPYDPPIRVEVIDVAALPAIMVPTAVQGPPTGGNPPPPPPPITP